MADAEIIIAIKSDGNSAKVIKRDLDAIAASGDKATGASAKLERQMRSTTSAAQYLSRAMGAIFAVVGVREILRISDSMSVLQGRLDNATRSAQESAQAFEGLRRTAMNTGSSLEAAVSVFQRLSFVRDEINATVTEMLQFTDTVSKLGVVSGASNEALRAGLTQLGQGLSSNILRAEEFNSIMENIPAVGKSIADQFGVTTGQLRQLVIEGEVLSKDVFAAILLSTEQANENFEKMPLTFSRAASVIAASFQGIFAELERTTGTANLLASAMLKVADIVSGLGNIFIGAANVAQAAFKAVIGVLYDLFAQFTNFVYSTLNGIISYANKLPGVDIGYLGLNERKNWVSGASNDLAEASKAFSTASKSFLGSNSTAVMQEQEKKSREISKNYSEIVKSISGADKANKAFKKSQDELTRAIKSSRTEEEKLIDEIKNLESQRGLAKATGQSAELEEAIRRARKELDDLGLQAELNGPVAKAFEALAREIDDGFKDAFRTAFTETDGGWKKMLEGWKSSFKALLADLAYTAFARPIIAQVVGVVGAGMGVSSSAQASILGQSGLGGSGGGLSLGNLGSIGSSLLNGGLYSSTLGNIGVGIGNTLSGLPFGAIGPWQAGSLQNVLGGAFGNMGYGAIGGLAASLFGLGSKNTMVNMLSGGLGSLAGGAIGSSLGTILGMAGGPVGAVAGGFLGTALGGLFGGGTPRETLSANFDYQNGMLALGGVSTKGGNVEDAQKFGSAIVTALNSLAAAVGGRATSPGNIQTNVGSKDTGTFLMNGGKVKVSSKAGDVEAVVRALVMGGNLQGGNSLLTDVLKKSYGMGSSADQALQDVMLARQIYGLDEAAQTTANAIEEINKQFDAMYERATQLGLPLDKLNEAIDKQRSAAIGLIKAQEAGFQSMEAMKATFDSWLYDQSLSSVSSLSPFAKLQAAQGNFGTLLDAVRGGDASQTQQLLQAGQQLLTLGQQMYASSVDFALMEKFVRDSISGIAKQLGVDGYASGTMSARSGFAWVGENGPELVRMRGGERVYNAEESKAMARSQAATDGRFADMSDRMASMDASMARMEAQMKRLVNNLIASAA